MSRLRSAAVSALVALATSFPGIAGAGPFDGFWELDGGPSSVCSEPVTLSFVVKDERISDGLLKGQRGTARGFGGQVSPDGAGTLLISRTEGLTGNLQFAGDSVTGKILARCGLRDFSGKRTKRE